MDAALIVVLPLVGGYIFASRWIVTKYVVDREDGHRLYFRAAFYGVFLFTAALLIRLILLSWFDSYSQIESVLSGELRGTLKEPNDPALRSTLVTALFALALGSIFWVPFEFIPQNWKRFLFHRAIRNNEFEILLARAVQSVTPISVTMENNKVYVGLLNESLHTGLNRKYLTVFPLMSGYRDSNNGKIQFTTFYNKIYKNLGRVSPSLRPEDFEILLPIEHIQSLNMFDIAVYTEFQKQKHNRKKRKSVGRRKPIR